MEGFPEFLQKKPGRPEGYKAAGKYGNGIKTKLFRIPEGKEDYVVAMINELPELLQEYEARMKDKKNWVEVKNLIDDIKLLMGEE